MSRARALTLLLVAGLLAGCAASTLPYAPAQQPAGFPISADYKVVGDRLRVEIDTGGSDSLLDYGVATPRYAGRRQKRE